MEKIAFENTHTLGQVVAENNQFRHFHCLEMLTMYDSNFIEFINLPSLLEFKEAESYLREYHLKKGQNHVKFYFQPNKKLTTELTTYLNDSGYGIGFLELYAIQPKHFPMLPKNPDIEIRVVTDTNLDKLINLKYKNDLMFGIEFATQKTELIKRQYNDQNILQVLAFYKGNPVGYVDMIISHETVEIDGLYVEEESRKKGIGSQIQKFVMESFPEKTVILLADGEDTPREMYKKQNYQYQGFKYEALKVYED